MALLNRAKYVAGFDHTLRDTRPIYQRIENMMTRSPNAFVAFITLGAVCYSIEDAVYFIDIIFLLSCWYFYYIMNKPRDLPWKMPATSRFKDPKNTGGGRSGKAEGILHIGNDLNDDREVWLTNSDARTHILYLGTTGAGKSEGLKSFVTNALCWGSGYLFIDGKADTDLWSSMSSLCRRFGRDDDLFVLNYMTGNSDERAPSNTMNPFASGSSSFLKELLVSLMPEAEGDNAMWKERAVALLSALMPAMTYKRDYQDLPLTVTAIRHALEFNKVIQLSRDETVPERLRDGLIGYLDTLPGYVAEAFDDDGKEKPAGPDTPMIDPTVPRQQHGYLSMQFTRALQSLGDDYGYIFDAQQPDVDMVDIVLNRRILIVLIPSLEKSGDEAANLGKIVVATIKGMMGTTLGADVEGVSETTIENKPTRSNTPFMTVFDEVGYYTAPGMGVMAAQARSLGFCLIFSAQDLPAMEKRVQEEAKSITANCNIKLFGKLADPDKTKTFYKETVDDEPVIQTTGFSKESGSLTGSYLDRGTGTTNTVMPKATWDEVQGRKEGEAVMAFKDEVRTVKIFFSNPGFAKAMRVQRFVPLPEVDKDHIKHAKSIAMLRDRLMSKTWTAANASSDTEHVKEMKLLEEGLSEFEKYAETLVDAGSAALVNFHVKTNDVDLEDVEDVTKSSTPSADSSPQEQGGISQNEKEPVTVGGHGGPDKGETELKSWSDFVGKSATEADDEDEGDQQSSGGGSGSVSPQSAGDYNAQQAVDAASKDASYQFPEGLNSEVQEILSQAADTLKSGLFGNPEIASQQMQAPASALEKSNPLPIKPGSNN